MKENIKKLPRKILKMTLMMTVGDYKNIKAGKDPEMIYDLRMKMFLTRDTGAPVSITVKPRVYIEEVNRLAREAMNEKENISV